MIQKRLKAHSPIAPGETEIEMQELASSVRQ